VNSEQWKSLKSFDERERASEEETLMPDPHTSLNEILNELHETLEASDDLGDEAREQLRDAVRDIRHAIGEDADGSGAPPSLADRLNEAIESFEGKHPKLTGIVGRIADTLSDMGI
jgi:hypothetical protein